MKQKIRLAVLASGGGTNLQSIIDQTQNGQLNAEIALVISNNPGAGALKRAEEAEIKSLCINHRDFTERKSFDLEVVKALESVQPDLIVLAGFMRIISSVFLKAFPQRIINIHPSLLPAFPGLHVQRKALEYGARFSGCTVHFVDDGVDTGPIIIQAVVPVHSDDTEETLSTRILEQEHKVYPQAIQWFADGRIKICDRKVIIESGEHASKAIINPASDRSLDNQ
jgi:phosphoribosylglycinamide formyltransferase 1